MLWIFGSFLYMGVYESSVFRLFDIRACPMPCRQGLIWTSVMRVDKLPKNLALKIYRIPADKK